MKVLLGVTGCIAAYKSCEILRELQKADVDIEVVMTEHACEFVSQTTFSALSGHPALVSNFSSHDDPIPHIRMAESCDIFLIAPCTGNMVAKVANGIADDLVSTCALAAHDKLAIAPAMNVHMYESPAIQANLDLLRSRGVKVLEPGSGYLACGDVGKGRLAEPTDICDEILSMLGNNSPKGKLSGKKVLVTAGPTRERIDPVRYLTNDSSGKMGYALAEAALTEGAAVTLVSGPVSIEAPKGADVIYVESAEEMLEASEKAFSNCDIAVFAAAVSDFRPKVKSSIKVKKRTGSDSLSKIELVENPDILATLASKKGDRVVIGFAAETDDVLENAKKKLISKGADVIVANEVGEDKTFGASSSKAWIVTPQGVKDLPEMSKLELAKEIIDFACSNSGLC